jgi:hypothetical protein
MNSTEVTSSAQAPPPDLATILRYRLRALSVRIGTRRALIALGLVAVAGGIALNWSWLTAIGVAPVLVATAPCAAMCALGLCMPKMMGGNSCASRQNPGKAADETIDLRSGPSQAMQQPTLELTSPDPKEKPMPKHMTTILAVAVLITGLMAPSLLYASQGSGMSMMGPATMGSGAMMGRDSGNMMGGGGRPNEQWRRD